LQEEVIEKLTKKYTVENAPSVDAIRSNLAVREAFITAKYLRKPYKEPSQSEKKKVEQKKNGTRNVNDGILRIKLIRGHDLLAADINSKSDPYVVFSTADQFVKSHVKKATLNPTWNETLMLNIPDFAHGVLECEVWDQDSVGSDDKLGKTTFKLSELKPNKATQKTLKLKKGEIVAEFEYTPL